MVAVRKKRLLSNRINGCRAGNQESSRKTELCAFRL